MIHSRYIVWSVDPLTLETFADTVPALDTIAACRVVNRMRPDTILSPGVPPMRVSDYIDNLQMGLGRHHKEERT